MNRARIHGVFLVPLILALSAHFAAQSKQTAEERQALLDDSPLNRPVSAVANIFDDNRRRQLNAEADARTPNPDLHVLEFRGSVPVFLDATLDFQAAVVSGGDSRKHAKTIHSQTDVFLRYVKWRGLRGKRPDTAPFEKLTPQHRTEEMMLSLSRILADLSRVLEDDKQLATSIQHTDNLASFEKEAYLLQWLSSHLR